MTAPQHETRDAHAKGILGFGIAFLIGALIMHLCLISLFSALRHHRESQLFLQSHPVNSKMTSLRQPPPKPQLQQDPKRDLQTYLEREKKLLSSYSWIDPQKKIIRIPIERAMDLIAERSIKSND